MELEILGFNEHFQNLYNDYFKDGFNFARVSEVNKNNYMVKDINSEVFAELTGKFMFIVDSPLNIPTVGDWVVVQYFENKSHAIIHDILPRKSVLKRKDPAKKVEFQLIAANIDYAFIMQAADENFNLNRLERYLVMVNETDIQPIILLSKCDLISEFELKEILDSIKRLKGKYKYYPISNITEYGLNYIFDELKPKKTYCLLGSSGVGKTTLLNKLLGSNMYEVNPVRKKDHKGKHTTTKRQLTLLKNGSIFIDTPGMRELGNFAVETGLSVTFDEIFKLSSQCRFADCTHIHEKGCAVIEAVENGTIDESRYKNFIKIQKESNFYSMSYLDKRKKDKQFGKMYKSVMKNNRKK